MKKRYLILDLSYTLNHYHYKLESTKQRKCILSKLKKLANIFRFKDRIPKILTLVLLWQMGKTPLSKNWEAYRKFIISKKIVKQKGSVVSDHLLLCGQLTL